MATRADIAIQTITVPFRASHPLDFDLLDANDDQVLYIDDQTSGHELTLTIRNAAGRAVYLLPLAGAVPDALNHHFALRFRDGVLSQATLRAFEVAGAADWTASRPLNDGDGIVIYLLRTQLQPWALGAGESVSLVLRHLSAAPGGGARATRVSLRTRALAYDSTGGSPIDETRTGLLNIVNHQGRRDNPFHIGFVGSNAVLNNGEDVNRLQLRITNILRDSAVNRRTELALMGPASDGQAARRTRFVVVIETEPEEEKDKVPWALARVGELNDMKVTAPTRDFEVRDGNLGPKREWIIEPKHDVTLPSGAAIDIAINGIISSLPTGTTYLVVHYANVPGFWDGQVVLAIEKTPLHLYKGSVGIGTTMPSGFEVVQSKGRLLFLDGNLGIGVDKPEERLDVGGNLVVRGYDFCLGRNNNARGNSGFSRALVKEDKNILTLNFANDFTGGVRINGKEVLVNGAAKFDGPASIQSRSQHLQLRRIDQNGGKVLFLELYQHDSKEEAFPSIRFHHSNRYWHRIEARTEGLLFKNGSLESDELTGIAAGALRIGNVTIGERELRILQRLASGKLHCEITNTHVDQRLITLDVPAPGLPIHFAGTVQANMLAAHASLARWRIEVLD